jgi:thioredoxin reductase (NADPH)
MSVRDLIVVGAGPAGVSAALWARTLHLDVEVIEGAAVPGGQLQHVHFHPRELPGIEFGHGRAIAQTYLRQLLEASIPVRWESAPRRSSRGPRRRCGSTTGRGSRRVRCCSRAVRRRRRLEVPGETTFDGRGLSYSATRDRAELAGRHVIVVGGGDAAYENALLLMAADCTVTLLVRGRTRARREFRERVAAESRITVHEGVAVRALLGDEVLRAVRIEDATGVRELACEGMVVKVGVIPNTEWCRAVVAHDADGWLQVDATQATSVPHVWAAGDVARPALPSISVAAGQGALAIAAIRRALHGA